MNFCVSIYNRYNNYVIIYNVKNLIFLFDFKNNKLLLGLFLSATMAAPVFNPEMTMNFFQKNLSRDVEERTGILLFLIVIHSLYIIITCPFTPTTCTVCKEPPMDCPTPP
jgi:hypothetical protein